jgi:hypothetical protein
MAHSPKFKEVLTNKIGERGFHGRQELLNSLKKIVPVKTNFKGAKKTFILEGEWDLKNLRPVWVKRIQKIDIETLDGQKKSTLETHDYSFDWQ